MFVVVVVVVVVVVEILRGCIAGWPSCAVECGVRSAECTGAHYHLHPFKYCATSNEVIHHMEAIMACCSVQRCLVIHIPRLLVSPLVLDRTGTAAQGGDPGVLPSAVVSCHNHRSPLASKPTSFLSTIAFTMFSSPSLQT